MRYGYFVNLDERGDFYADVRDENEKTLFEVRSNDEGIVEAIEDGFMSAKDDVEGLTEWLRDLGVIGKNEEVLPSVEFETQLEGENREAAADKERLVRLAGIRLGYQAEAVTAMEIDENDIRTIIVKNADTEDLGTPDGLVAVSWDKHSDSAMFQTENSSEGYLVPSFEAPQKTIMRSFISVEDKEFFDHLANDEVFISPPPEARLIAAMSHEVKGEAIMITAEAQSADLMATFREARIARATTGYDLGEWVPASLSEAVYEICLASAPTGSPCDYGFAFDHSLIWPEIEKVSPGAASAVVEWGPKTALDFHDGYVLQDSVSFGAEEIFAFSERTGEPVTIPKAALQEAVHRMHEKIREIELADLNM